MEHEELMPDDQEQISRLEYQVTRLNTILNGDKGTRHKGFIAETDERLTSIEGNVVDVKQLSKQIRVGIWCLVIGVVLAAIIFGVIKIQEAVAIVK